jgi:hypothetical protein
LSSSNSESGSSFSLLGGVPLSSSSTNIYYIGFSKQFSSASNTQTFSNTYGFIMIGEDTWN